MAAPNSLGRPGLTPNGFTTQTGTYHVNDDCTGADTMSQPGLSFTLALVVSDRGRKIRYVGTSAHARYNSRKPKLHLRLLRGSRRRRRR